MLQLATFFLVVVPILFIAFVERMGGTGGREREREREREIGMGMAIGMGMRKK